MKDEDGIIAEIIESFKGMALRDIEVNLVNPVAAFILCSCLIDQLATFIYNEPNEKNNVIYNRFLSQYLDHYRGLNLYTNLRCNLVHNYTVSKGISITNDEAPYKNIGVGNSVTVLTSKMMYEDLKIVFDKICIELNDKNSTIRVNAIGAYKYKDRQIISKSVQKFTTYIESEADTLIKHYKERLKGGIILHNNKGTKKFEIIDINKEEFAPGCFLVSVAAIHKKEKIEPQIDDLVNLLGIETPSDVLNSLGHS